MHRMFEDLLSNSDDDEGSSFHWSKVDENEWPIHLEQYRNRIVVRFCDYTGEFVRFVREASAYRLWSKSEGSKLFIDIEMEQDALPELISSFQNLPYKVIIEDLAQSVFESYPDKQERKMRATTEKEINEPTYQITEDIIRISKEEGFHAASEIFFKDYRPLETIQAWLDLLVQAYPELVERQYLGATPEGRKYDHIHIRSPNGEHKDKRTILITGGTHAREWISVSTSLYAIYEMVNFYSQYPGLDAALRLDFIIAPLMNPDGYAYTWSNDRLWRKNRQPTEFSGCVGIDIDHSFDFHWTHSSDWACGEDYSGEYAFEAKESWLWYQHMNTTKFHHNIWGYVDLHSYSQDILYPYAYSCDDQPRDEENLIELAYGIAKAIRQHSGVYYDVLPACIDRDSDLIPDLGAGTALDYMYKYGAIWAFQLKLRDSGNHGFLLPAKYIEPVGLETWEGIRYFIRFILSDDRYS
ncbi:putative metallocarboxypeptidase ecm14 [Scheffersomyces spartinae]|uniref:Inactive metallocarboxypeptidase ECM14 n=1 Tax=Scheffersomyces spartinae TaxID=45513 RepID=A0A9P7V552_9ASCO|nr:putative metallocarboxypeptidase ecm14 [Scheffersomyces spartinae]KAG7191341.1 putative metallocarboxypeptidase ecm14 [Scheffersomyces spartinae]